MDRIDLLEKKVRDIYEQKNPERADWADWMYENHVFIVSDKAKELSETENITNDLAQSASMLHDIADAVTNRFSDDHEEVSLSMAQDILSECGYLDEEINIVVNDILKNHGCHEGKNPKTIEGKIMTTADAWAHIMTDFYSFGEEQLQEEGKDKKEIEYWVIPKLERDFTNKIFLDEIVREVEPEYLKLKEYFKV